MYKPFRRQVGKQDKRTPSNQPAYRVDLTHHARIIPRHRTLPYDFRKYYNKKVIDQHGQVCYVF